MHCFEPTYTRLIVVVIQSTCYSLPQRYAIVRCATLAQLRSLLVAQLGILSRTQPRLITTLQVVPPGTNGAVSMFGTLMSLAGGLLVGVASVLALAFDNNGACSRDGSSKGWVFHVLVVGAFGGLAGSLVGARHTHSSRQALIKGTCGLLFPDRFIARRNSTGIALFSFRQADRPLA